MNKSNPNQAAAKLETDRLWHELRESQTREKAMALAGLNLVNAITSEFGSEVPSRTRRMRNRMIDVLPRDFRNQVDLVPDPGADEEMGSIAKWIMIVGFPLFLGLTGWAYFITLVKN